MLKTFEEMMHGIPISDSHRWLEDRSTPETALWIGEQRRKCDAYFKTVPGIGFLESRVREYLDVVEIDQPAKIGEHYVYRKRARGQEQGSLCIRDADHERVLVDPSIDGEYASANIHRIAQDGTYLAYEFGRGGEDRKEIRLVALKTGMVLPDRIPCGYPRGFAFAADGYFYCQETELKSAFHEVRYHSLGALDEDAIVLRLPRTPGSRLALKADEVRLGVLWYRSEGNDVVVDFLIAKPNDPSSWLQVFRQKVVPFVPLLSHGRIFAIVETESKCSQIIQFSESGEELHTIVPAREVPIRQVAFTRDCIYASYLTDGIASIDCWSFQGAHFPSLSLPPHGSVQLLPTYGHDARSIFFGFESFDTPSIILEHNNDLREPEEWFRRSQPNRLTLFEVEKIQVSSADGTLFPMTLVSGSQRTARGPAPVIMTSYGGFGASMTPRFSVLVTLMIELGATFALPHIRGGSEFGRAWHDAGCRRNRQATFDDFIAAAEWLCANGRCVPRLLGIFGGSNGGLLVGAAMTQRPDLFGAVLCIAPLLDMLRYECFDRALDWRREFGTVTDPLDFRALHAYSPYHRIDNTTDYPATLFVTGEKDDRCNPAHVRKMAAALQDRPCQSAPVIVDYSEERGHSPVLPLSTRAKALARRIAFLCHELNIDVPDGVGR